MNSVFDRAFEKIIVTEGGYVNNPFDKGSETRYGVTKKVAKKHGYTDDMKDLPIGLTKYIYRHDYWDKMNLDRVVNPNWEGSEDIAHELFDSGVNVGPGLASKWFQRALNLLNRDERDYSDLVVDGDIGNYTIKTYSKDMPHNALSLYKILNLFQGAHYLSLAEKDHSQEIFIRGWLKRVMVRSRSVPMIPFPDGYTIEGVSVDMDLLAGRCFRSPFCSVNVSEKKISVQIPEGDLLVFESSNVTNLRISGPRTAPSRTVRNHPEACDCKTCKLMRSL